jgi:hypothetical protein
MSGKIELGKVVAGTACVREVRLDPAGRPVFCTSSAVMAINTKPLCQRHAQEAMLAFEAQQTATANVAS